MSHYIHKSTPDAKFESGGFSIFGDMMSQNFSVEKGTSHQIRLFTKENGSNFLKNELFMSRIVLFDPKLTFHVNFSNFQAEETLYFQNLFSRLNEKKAAATPLIDKFC